MVALCVSLAGLGALTKSSALAASVPMLGLGLVGWAGILVSGWLTTRDKSAAKPGARRASLVPAMYALLALVLLSAPLVSYQTRVDLAAGWSLNNSPLARASRIYASTAHDGLYVIELGGADRNDVASQVLLPANLYHPALEVEVLGWARLPDRAGEQRQIASPQTPSLRIQIYHGSDQAERGEAVVELQDGWVPFNIQACLPASAEQISLRVQAEGGAVQLDDLSVKLKGAFTTWQDPIHLGALVNPSGEEPYLALRDPIARLLPDEVEWMAAVLANPQPFSKEALWQYYARMQYRSFWGDFGWVSLPLPDAAYALLGGITLLAMAGLGLLGIRRRGGWSYPEWAGLIILLTFSAAVAIGFVRQTAAFAFSDVRAYPQGRYLFVLIIPVVWLLLLGLRELIKTASGLLLSTLNARASSKAAGIEAEAAQRSLASPAWGVWLCVNALLTFAVYCLLSLIIPFYYGT
jgi:hypothetical protein